MRKNQNKRVAATRILAIVMAALMLLGVASTLLFYLFY